MSKAAARSEDGLAPWEVSEFDFPERADAHSKLAFCVRYAILAPSSHNSQPWRFVIRDDALEVYADSSRALPVVDPHHRELTISCGAAITNLLIACRYFGYRGELKVLPAHSDALARIRLGQPHACEPSERNLFHAIGKRRTNRTAFEDRIVSALVLGEMALACAQHGVWFETVVDPVKKQSIADLVAEGDRIQMASAEFRDELARWMRPARAPERDGMPCYTQGMARGLDPLTPLLARLIRTFDIGGMTAAHDKDLVLYSPVLAVLGTQSDRRADWVGVGQALERAVLIARAAGVWVSYLNQPIEVPALRERLAQLSGQPGAPQILLRLGYGAEVDPTPRRDLGEVLLALD